MTGAALQAKALFQHCIFAQHQQRQAAVQHGFRRDIHISFVVPPHAEDVDAVLSADVQLTMLCPCQLSGTATSIMACFSPSSM